MRPVIRLALECSAQLTRQNRLDEAMTVAEGAFRRATADEHPEIEQWLIDHTSDFTGED
ncbi:hypothetical protein L7D48_10535 [Streptomyces sp. S1A]|uniref:hypothetical protein n=1 Tax=Streptomyces sp. ICN903 TaxID=2964654 RepID=UPI001EDA50C0|nr:hypothetical protein [Streptomyces sp. ICN903]MCG3040994.1 hypothetical protein [Streptomyces sp. ICN903]